MHQPRISHLETAVTLALEMGAVLRDPARYNSEEWHQVVKKRQDFNRYLKSLDVDTRIIETKVQSIPPEMYGEDKFMPHYENSGYVPAQAPTPSAEQPELVVISVLAPPVLPDRLAA